AGAAEDRIAARRVGVVGGYAGVADVDAEAAVAVEAVLVDAVAAAGAWHDAHALLPIAVDPVGRADIVAVGAVLDHHTHAAVAGARAGCRAGLHVGTDAVLPDFVSFGALTGHHDPVERVAADPVALDQVVGAIDSDAGAVGQGVDAILVQPDQVGLHEIVPAANTLEGGDQHADIAGTADQVASVNSAADGGSADIAADQGDRLRV